MFWFVIFPDSRGQWEQRWQDTRRPECRLLEKVGDKAGVIPQKAFKRGWHDWICVWGRPFCQLVWTLNESLERCLKTALWQGTFLSILFSTAQRPREGWILKSDLCKWDEPLDEVVDLSVCINASSLQPAEFREGADMGWEGMSMRLLKKGVQ